MHDAQFARGDAIKDFGPQDQALSERRITYPREPLSAAGPGNQPEAHLRQSELGFVRSDPKIAGQRELQTSAYRRPSDLGHRNLRQPFDSCVKPLNAGDVGIHPIRTIGHIHARAHFLKISASTEHFLIGTNVQYPATRLGSQRIKLCVE